MNNMFNRYAEFPKHHVAVTPSDTVNIPHGPLVIMALTAGVLAAVDDFNTVVNYTVGVGDILPVLVKRVNSTNSTATCIGLY